MSIKCVYGDVETSEVVPCQYDPHSNTFTCPQPRSISAANSTSQPRKPRELEVVVRFIREDGEEESKGTLVARYDRMKPTEEEEELVEVRLVQDSNSDRAESLAGPGRRRGTSFQGNLIKAFSIILADITGEFIGTFFLTLVICTAVTTSVMSGALQGLWQVAIVCGLGVGLSIYCTSYISSAHLNPAVTIAFAILRGWDFTYEKVLHYIIAQLLGGFCAGGVLYGIYRHAIELFEKDRGLERGRNGSELSAMVFGEYFPNPAVYGHKMSSDVISPTGAMLVEAWATGVLVFVIFSLTDHQNTAVGSGKHRVAVPVLIGITVSVLISIYAPLTQAGMNPARDFGPRVFATIVGWGEIAIPGPRKGFWVYIVGPIIGGPIGGAVYDLLVAHAVWFARTSTNRHFRLSTRSTGSDISIN